jgi:hypothetical protein
MLAKQVLIRQTAARVFAADDRARAGRASGVATMRCVRAGAAATTTWLLEAVDDGASKRQPLRVGFTHGADEEDLVVHGEPVEDAGDHDRQRLSRGPPVSRPTSPMNRPPPI